MADDRLSQAEHIYRQALTTERDALHTLEMQFTQVKPLLQSMATLVTLYTDGWRTAVGTYSRSRNWIDQDMHALYDHYARLVEEIKTQFTEQKGMTL